MQHPASENVRAVLQNVMPCVTFMHMADNNSPRLTDDAFRALVGRELTARCDWKGHADGACGGPAAESGAFVVLAMPHDSASDLDPAVVMTCVSRVIWLRARADLMTSCPDCSTVIRFGDTFKLCGPAASFDASILAR